jgi:hypothetical protein
MEERAGERRRVLFQAQDWPSLQFSPHSDLLGERGRTATICVRGSKVRRIVHTGLFGP